MSFLDRFTKKKTAKQLEETSAGLAIKEKASVDVEKQKARSAVVGSITHRVIIGPMVTEKAAVLQTAVNQYSFIIARNATKAAVKKAVKELYGVDALKIRVINTQGHRVRFGQSQGRRQDFKKAIVQLAKGQTIAAHEGV